MDFIAEFTNLEEKVRSADFVITGEGKVDSQTLSGKVVKGVADLAKNTKKPLIVIAGKNELDPQQLAQLGVTGLITLVTINLGARGHPACGTGLKKQGQGTNYSSFSLALGDLTLPPCQLKESLKLKIHV